MPEQNPKKGGFKTRPPVKAPPLNPGVLDRLIAALKGAGDEPFAPNVQEGLRLLQQEEANFDPSIVRPKSGGIIGAFHVPKGAEASATPFGNIRVDTGMMVGKNPQEVADTLLHEYTHVKQMKPRGVIGQILHILGEDLPYGQRPDEMEAFQAEADRRTRMGRAPLYGTPHFLDATQETRGDIALHSKYPMIKK